MSASEGESGHRRVRSGCLFLTLSGASFASYRERSQASGPREALRCAKLWIAVDWCGGSARAHHQPEAVMLDFVNAEFFATIFFSALRFLVAVLSDLSGCSWVLKALFSKVSRRPRYSRSLIRSFLFITHLTRWRWS